MLGLVAKMTALAGPEYSLKFPRIVPDSARIFRHALTGDMDEMRDLFAAGLASPTDTDALSGTTALHVGSSSLLPLETTLTYCCRPHAMQ